MNNISRNGVAWTVSALWAGLILGVSFFAAPIKFTAEGISQSDLLAVGKVTFQAFTWIELAAFVLLLAVTLRTPARTVLICVAAIGGLLAVQKLGILPLLDTGLDNVRAGQPRQDNSLHFVYVIIDGVKLVLLLSLPLLFREPATER